MRTILKLLGFTFVVYLAADLIVDFVEKRTVNKILSSPGWEEEKAELDGRAGHKPEFVGVV